MASRLIPITVSAPGTKGLNLQEQGSLLGPEWCRIGNNLSIDNSGRIGARDGWAKSHSTALTLTPDVEQIFEYKPNTGNNVEIFCAGNKIYRDRTSPVDITGALSITANNWKFQNFNGNVVGYQALHDPIIWKGAGNFTLLSAEAGAAGLVQSNEVLTAYGRTWVVDPVDDSTLRYSDLLIPQNFSTGSSGAIGLKAVWTRGQDKIIALGAFNNQLIIFGKDTTTVYDGADELANLALAEVIYDIGCVARDSVEYIDEDIFFLSRTGVRSYKRTIIRNKMPQGDITKNVRDDIISVLAVEDVNKIRSVYSKSKGQYLLTFPTSDTVYNIDIKKYVSSGEVRVFKWNSIRPLALAYSETDVVLAGFSGGWVGTLTGKNDNEDSYLIEFRSAWTDIATLVQDRALAAKLIILKKYEAVLSANNSINPSLSWDFDYTSSGLSRQISFLAGNLVEYNLFPAEYNIAEYGGGSTSTTFSVNASGSGRVFSFGITVSVNSVDIKYQYANLMFKLGRIT